MQSAILLLETGRASMALAVLRSIPAGVVERDRCRHLERLEAERRRELACLECSIVGRRRALARLERPEPPWRVRAKPHEQLAEALAAGRVTAERVAEVLNVGVEDVAPIAAGRIEFKPTAWKRVLEALG